MQQTFKNMGVSCFGACFAQIGAGCILYGTNLILLQRLCYVLVCSGVISLVSILLLFGAVMHICGPEFGTGDLFYYCREQVDDD